MAYKTKTRKRRIVYAEDCKKTMEEKRPTINKEVGGVKSRTTRRKIELFIKNNVNSKITAKFVSEGLSISLRTAKGYLSIINKEKKQKND